MALSKSQQAAIKSSFAKVMSDGEVFAASFYANLFEHDPALRKLFKTDMKQQGDVLMRMLSIAVVGLDRPNDLMPALHDLGRHHVAYGVKPEHYEPFGEALKQTLSESLGAEYTPDVGAAWNEFYDTLAAGAIEGLNS